jgi:hypothetical protein
MNPGWSEVDANNGNILERFLQTSENHDCKNLEIFRDILRSGMVHEIRKNKNETIISIYPRSK